MIPVFVSLISGNLACIEEDIKKMEPDCTGFHLDMMDGHFVNNLTWGPDVVNAIRQTTDKPLQIHLMVDHPEQYFSRLKLFANDVISIHIESPSNHTCEELFSLITKTGTQPGLAVSPETPIEQIAQLKHQPTHVTLMGVNPGFSGQKLLAQTPERLKKLVALRVKQNLSFTIALDGGVTLANKQLLMTAGADQLIAASAIFKAAHPIHALKELAS